MQSLVHRRCVNYGLMKHNGEDMQQMRSSAALAIIGFIIVACALATNTILARANAGEVPSFSLASFAG
jgi:hypothetical protein